MARFRKKSSERVVGFDLRLGLSNEPRYPWKLSLSGRLVSPMYCQYDVN